MELLIENYFLIFIFGCITFPSMFFIFLNFQNKYLSQYLSKEDCYVISLRLVSSIQAILASASGIVIVSASYNKDLMNYRHWLTETYAWFAVPYFYYDTWAMFKAYRLKKTHLLSTPVIQAFVIFLQHNKVMMAHHLVVPLIYFPTVVWLRKGQGDFFMGCFLLFEVTVPFISLRAVLVQLHKNNTILYFVCGILMILSFFVCRVLLFPFMYWCYAWHRGVPVQQVPYLIPRKCNIGCLLLFSFQVYWLAIMLRTTARIVQSYRRSSDTKSLKVT